MHQLLQLKKCQVKYNRVYFVNHLLWQRNRLYYFYYRFKKDEINFKKCEEVRECTNYYATICAQTGKNDAPDNGSNFRHRYFGLFCFISTVQFSNAYFTETKKSTVNARKSVIIPTTTKADVKNVRKSIYGTNLTTKGKKSIASLASPSVVVKKNPVIGNKKDIRKTFYRNESIPVSSSSSDNRGAKSTTVINRNARETRRTTMSRHDVASHTSSTNNKKTITASTITAEALQPSTTNKIIFNKPKNSFKCNSCDKTFLLKSNLMKHEKCHETSNGNNCKYCDKTFTLKTALDNHLLKYCTKIPTADRRKLLENPNKLRKTNSSTVTNQPLKSSDSSSSSFNDSTSSNGYAKAPQSATKKAHSGISRTPHKTIRCHTCGIQFPDILSFTTHAETHSAMEV